ncbi:MAG: hypothetical protein H6500_01330 [Candidatus Woesearchaeota archaeon]|nr:hypothetical protein [Nanoarchaeota archaeon]USN44471.1 MAG: hypothetical protein H6500_01330 [Candidatus Woesearchaeota archaeon]
MDYVSRFEDLYDEGWQLPLSIRTSLGQVLTELEGVQKNLLLGYSQKRTLVDFSWKKEEGGGYSPSGTDILVLHPPRMIRAIIEEKLSSNNPVLLPILGLCTSLALDIYSSNTFGDKLQELRNEVKKNNLSSLLDKEITQKSDRVTCTASSPCFSSSTAESLRKDFPGGNILFLPLANGGTMAG